MEDIDVENDNQSYQHHDVMRNENESKPSQSSRMIGIEDRYNDAANTFDVHNDSDTKQLPSNENASTFINTEVTNTTTNAGGNTHDAYNNYGNNYDEEFTTVSMSPDERNTFFPSSSSSRRTLLYDQQQQHYNNPIRGGGDDDHNMQQHRNTLMNTGRPSRESVLHRLCEALLRRSLTKVCVRKIKHFYWCGDERCCGKDHV